MHVTSFNRVVGPLASRRSAEDGLTGKLVGEVATKELTHGGIPPGGDVTRAAGERTVDEVRLPHDDAMAPRDERGAELVCEVPVHRSDDRGSQTRHVEECERRIGGQILWQVRCGGTRARAALTRPRRPPATVANLETWATQTDATLIE